MRDINHTFELLRESYGDSVVTYDGMRLIAKNRYDLGSELSFNWGDDSVGSEALSYTILEKIGSAEIAERYAQSYMKSVIAHVHQDRWTLNASAVIQWINQNTNFMIDESAYIKDGTIRYDYKERRQEERRKEERRIQREKEFMEEAQRRLKLREERRAEDDRRQGDRRVSKEQHYQEIAQKRLQEIQTQNQKEIDFYKKQIKDQNVMIEACKERLEKYKLFIKSKDLQVECDEFCNLNS